MSTLSGIPSKGEKGKPRFQSLDINNLYKKSRGESSEQHQQRNTIQRRHGMQVLGKVPSARRPPANLPSLKSEHSGNDPAVSLVPSGGTGWGSKPGETGPTPTSQPNTQTSTLTTAPANPSGQTNAVSSGASVATPAGLTAQVPQQVGLGASGVGPVVVPSGGDKTWSSVTCGGETAPSFLAHQSPQFQQEFPSLSGEAVGPGPPLVKPDTQYGPGPSLRPQTEGSWIQGGGTRGVQGSTSTVPAGGNQPASIPSQDGGVRNNLGQYGGGGVPAGPQPAPSASNFKVFPSFMGNRGVVYPSMLTGNFQNTIRPPARYQYPPDNRISQGSRPPPLMTDPEDLIPRPIIKEEDLNRMDELARDASWAEHDDADYEQNLAFSDDETAEDEKESAEKKDKDKGKQGSHDTREEKKEPEEVREKQGDRVISPGERNQPWQGRGNSAVSSLPSADYRGPPTSRNTIQGNRDDEEIWREKRRQHSEQVAAVAEKAKQRKEEEEKRFEESRAKSHLLDSEKKKIKDDVIANDTQHTVNAPNMSEWDKEEKGPPSSTSNKEAVDNFREMTQLESRTNFGRERDRDREMRSERDGQSYQRFNVLPPRFQKQHIDRPSNQQFTRQSSIGGGSNQNYDNRWSMHTSQNTHFSGKSVSSGNRRNRTESELSDKDPAREREKERDEEIKERERRDRHTPESNTERERFRGGCRPYESRKGYYETSDYNRFYQRDREFDRDRERNKDMDYKQRERDSERDGDSEWESRRGAPEWDNNRHCDDRSQGRRDVKKPSDNFKTLDPDWREREKPQRPDSRDRPERPQRPDSRDSRTSRDSRNSRESNREEPRFIQEAVDNECGWGNSEFEKEHKEEKSYHKDNYKEDRRERDNHNQHRQREAHGRVPGPITREKMEAYEHKQNLALGDKKETSVLGGVVGDEESWSKGQNANSGPGNGNTPWSEATDEGLTQQEASKETLQTQELIKEEVNEKDELDKKKENGKKDREKGTRMGGRSSLRGGRQGGYNTSSFPVNRSNWSGRNEIKNKRGGAVRNPSQKSHWNPSESEISGDEVSASTESGKEDKKLDHKQTPRSPKSGSRKSDKENRNKESQLVDEKSVGGGTAPKPERKQGSIGSGDTSRKEREGFAPRGEPSRRGRGGGFRTRGSMSNIGGHYGPPGTKSPFPPAQGPQDLKQDDDDKGEKHSIDSELSHEEKMKLNQQALSAGITGLSRQQKGDRDGPQMRKIDGDMNQRLNKTKPKLSDQLEDWETTSETSDNEGKGKKGHMRHKQEKKMPLGRGPIGEKRGGYNSAQMNGRPGRLDEAKSGPEDCMTDKKRDGTDQINFANNGFQEVRNKKTGKDGRPSKEESKRGRGGKGKEKTNNQGSGRGQGQTKPRDWNNKPPRLQRIENLRKQLQQRQEVSELNKINTLFTPRDVGCAPPAPPPSVNAWDKPITTLRTTPPPPTNPLQLAATINSQDKSGIDLNDHGQSGTSSQTSSPSAEKALTKMSREAVEKGLLDGTTPPVQTIIFENTNYKAPPGDMTLKSRYNIKSQRMDKGRDRKIEEELEESSHGMGLGGFKTGELKPGDKTQESIQMPMTFNKNEDNADMKLDFAFDSELAQLTDDKSNISRCIHLGQTSAADLDQKIASVKKVWDSPAGSVMEHQHHVDESHGVVSTASSFTPPYGGGVDASLDPSAGHQVDDSAFANPDVYSSGPQLQGSNSYVASVPNMIKQDPSNSSSNVCKVKAQPQPTAVMSSGMVQHPGPSPISPPPFTQQGHINFQGAPYSGIPAVPSPPAVIYNSAQQVPSQGDLYHTFPLGGAPVLSGQGRSGFTQFPAYNLQQGLGPTSAYSQQSVYMHQAAASNGPPDVFPSISQYRMQPSSFQHGQSQLTSNPNTVLISSSSNSLMSASVKQSTQPIGAIGTKAPYQSSGPTHSQVYFPYEAQLLTQSFLQQRPGNSVVPSLQPSPSYYSNSAGAQTGLFQAGNSILQGAGSAPQPPLHSAPPTPFGMQGFGTQSPAPAPSAGSNPVGVASYPSQMSHYRGQTAFLKPGGPTGQHPADSAKSPSSNQDLMQSVFSSGNQIPSPKSRGGGGKQGNPSGSQQPSPTQAHHKFSSYPAHSVPQANLAMHPQQQGGGGGQRGAQHLGGGGMGSGGGSRGSGAPSMRYPPPIQRPGSLQPNNMMQQPSRQRMPPPPRHTMVNKMSNHQYFQQQGNSVKLEGNSVEAKPETGSECKIVDNGSSGTGGKQLPQSCDKVKEDTSSNSEQ